MPNGRSVRCKSAWEGSSHERSVRQSTLRRSVRMPCSTKSASVKARHARLTHRRLAEPPLRPALFGGADPQGVAQFLSPTLAGVSYDAALMRRAASALPELSDEEAALISQKPETGNRLETGNRSESRSVG